MVKSTFIHAKHSAGVAQTKIVHLWFKDLLTVELSAKAERERSIDIEYYCGTKFFTVMLFCFFLNSHSIMAVKLSYLFIFFF